MKFHLKINLFLLMSLASSSAWTRQLMDVVLQRGMRETSVKVYFKGEEAEGPYPLYSQKYVSGKQSLTLSFLETETALPLGLHGLEAGILGVSEISLRRITSPSGKIFLGLELKGSDSLAGEVKVEAIPKGGLKFILGPGAKKKLSWSLSKSLKAKVTAENKVALASEEKPQTQAQSQTQITPATESLSKSAPQPPIANKSAIAQDTFPKSLSSAHEAGAKLEAKPSSGALSLSKVFSPGNNGKPMVILKDSAEMKTEPGSKGQVLKKISLGTKVLKLASQEGWMKIVEGMDTGYVRNKEGVYIDEITDAQQKSLVKRLEAKETKIKEAQAKAEKLAQARLDSAKAEMESAQVKAEPVPTPSAPPEKKVPVSPPSPTTDSMPKLSISENPEFAEKLAAEKKLAEEENLRIEPEENRVTYNSFGRRDPFIPVDQGNADNGIDIDQMKVVGIIWQASEPMAVLEHTRDVNISYTVKEGDPIHNGRVGKISRDAVTFDISEYGISRSYSLKLVSSKEGTKK